MKILHAVPRKCTEISITDGTGVLVKVRLNPSQIWKVSNQNPYKILSRKSSSGFRLRLTKRMYDEYFITADTEFNDD